MRVLQATDGDGVLCAVERSIYRRQFATPTQGVFHDQHNAKIFLRFSEVDANEIGSWTKAPESNAMMQVCVSNF